MYIEYALNAWDLYLVPQKIAERLEIYFSRNRRLKLSYFHDFDAANALFYVYFQLYFTHIFLKNDLVLKMTAITRPFQQALDEWCEINSFAVIVEKPSFDDTTRADTILGKNGPNLRSRPNEKPGAYMPPLVLSVGKRGLVLEGLYYLSFIYYVF